MKVFPDMIQGSEDWFAARRGRPTASNFSRIITAKGLKMSSQAEGYALELIAETLRPDEVQQAFTGNFHTDRGNELEPLAREEFIKTLNLDVRTVGFVTREDGIVGCSPDGLIYKGDEPVAGVEIKCPMAKNHLSYHLGDELPTEHIIQVHGSMAVTGLDAWYFMSYCQGVKPFIKLVRRNAVTEAVSSALDTFLLLYSATKKRVIDKLEA